MFNRIGAKINHYATRGARLGKKVAGHVKRLGEKVLPLAKGVLGLVQAVGGNNKMVGKLVSAGNAGVAMGDKAVALSNRVLAHQGTGSMVSTIRDRTGRAYKSMVAGDSTQALGLLRDGQRVAGSVRTQVVSQAKSALQKVRRK